ncbi:Butyryl-CoA:acetate CoA-transferase (plasmid) [Sphingobium sp. AntQ-1]|uniref:acetyl-CoA hydrolase/transferase family protein n=1 Tax=Sphingobium sp. AntQ-1 TaxID=2930091 RepID=UPI00234F591D|nr:acetyl-CoA hydrolase/transferase C-terminal domain-containing protein [Sphingobium sp. AntQ-1]WCP15961.1 Butyryl-CoA:acetate CoA-transferase [Sphingobium sp. AntQ-1]
MIRLGREAKLDAIDWAQLIRPGDLVVWGQASAEPVMLAESLLAQRGSIGGFQAFIGIGWSSNISLAHVDHVAFSSYCGTGTNRHLGDHLDILPIPYAALAPTLGARAPVLLLRLAPGRDADHFGFGAAQDYVADLMDQARLVIAEVADDAPCTGEGMEISRERIDIFVRTSRPNASAGLTRFGEVERAIAARMAGLVEDGATLQIGLGSIPAALMRALTNHRDLGIHSGLIGDEVADLAEAGIITNARKTIDRGVSVAGLLAGGERLMRWANANKALRLRPASYTHSHATLAAIDRLAAINSAIEVDLSGQVNAEVADGRYVGAVGGASTFLRGAAASRGGLPIVVLPATAGARSRIVARLSGPVSTARADAGIFVTEYGVADLRGLGLRARQQKMLDIAAPAHRAAIEADIRSAERS